MQAWKGSRADAMRILILSCFLVAASACMAQQPSPGQPAQTPQSEQQANPFPESQSEAAQRQAQQQQQQQATPPSPSPASAQPAPKPAPKVQYFPPDPNQEPPTFHVSTSVVVVPTLVEKRDGDVLYG